MDNNNNIEDFFNNSMDQFNDNPPDSVWDGIGGMLDEDKTPFYKNAKLWAGLGAILTLVLIALYIFNTHQKINTLNDKLDQFEGKNIELESNIVDLKSEIIECGERADNLIHIINGYKGEQVTPQTPSKKTTNNTLGEVITPIQETNNIVPSSTMVNNQYRTSQIVTTPISPISNNTSTLVEKSIPEEEQIMEDVLPSEFTEEVDSIIIENNEMLEKGKKMVKVPIYSYDKDSIKSVEVEKMNPKVGENIKERFNGMKDKLKEKKWDIFKRKKNRKKE